MGASLEAQMPTNMPAMQETRIQSSGQEYALEEGMATHSRILAWRIPMDRGSLASYSPEGRRVGHNWSDLACRHARTVRTRTQCSCMHTGICVLDLSIHLLSWGLTYQDCCVTWAAREVDPMGLANFASPQTISTLFVCWRCRSLCCILPWQKLRALSCFLGWPVYTPSERGVCLFFFLLSQAWPLLLLLSQKPSSLHILIHPRLPQQPPTHTCKSHSHGVGFIITGQKAFS